MEILLPSRVSVMRNAVIKDLYKIRDEIQEHFAVPSFESDYDYYADFHSGVEESINCLGYALQIHRKFTPSNKGYPWLEPGSFSGEYCQPYTEKTLINAFKSDCDFLGIDITEVDKRAPLKKDSYKIGVFFDFTRIYKDKSWDTPKTDYHFIRQNADGTWSFKHGWFGPVEISDGKNIGTRFDLVGTYEISKKR
jgi:hypothetical protein